MFDEYMKRSGQLPLTLGFLATGPDILSEEQKVICELLLKAQENRHRWYDVTIELQDHPTSQRSDVPPASSPIDISICLRDTPILKSLAIYSYVRHHFHIQLQLSPCSHLKSLSIGGLLLVDLEATNLSRDYFPQLSSVVWRPHIIQPFLKNRTLIEYFVNAEDLTLSLHSNSSEIEPDSVYPALRFPKLRRLTLQRDHGRGFYAIFPFIFAPLLRKLDLGEPIALDSTGITKLADKVRSMPLQYLALNVMARPEAPIEKTIFLAFTESIGGLRHLKLRFDRKNYLHAFASAFLQVSVTNPGHTSVLPVLKTLEIDLSSLWDVEEPFAIPSLKQVILVCSRTRSTGFHVRLRLFEGPTRGNGGIDHAREYLRCDQEIMACCSGAFKVAVNGIELEASSRNDGEHF